MKGLGHCCGFSFSGGVEHGYGHHEVTILAECFRRPTGHQREGLVPKGEDPLILADPGHPLK